MFGYFGIVNLVVRGVYFSVGSDEAVYMVIGNESKCYHFYGMLFDTLISGIIKEPLEDVVNDLVDEGTLSGFDRRSVTSKVLEEL